VIAAKYSHLIGNVSGGFRLIVTAQVTGVPAPKISHNLSKAAPENAHLHETSPLSSTCLLVHWRWHTNLLPWNTLNYIIIFTAQTRSAVSQRMYSITCHRQDSASRCGTENTGSSISTNRRFEIESSHKKSHEFNPP